MKLRVKAFFRVFCCTMYAVLVMLTNQGCYNYRIQPPHFDPATEYSKKTAHSLFWGLAQKNVSAGNCAATHGMDEVKITTNLGFALITVASLGIWCPLTVEWKCAKPCQQESEL